MGRGGAGHAPARDDQRRPGPRLSACRHGNTRGSPAEPRRRHRAADEASCLRNELSVVATMESTETTMKRPNGSTALLTLFLGLSLVSLALARSHRDTPALPRLVAT